MAASTPFDEGSDDASPGAESDPGSGTVDPLPQAVGRPASRALFSAGYRSLDDLAGASEAKLAQLHGVGPKALAVLKAALAARGTPLAP